MVDSPLASAGPPDLPTERLYTQQSAIHRRMQVAQDVNDILLEIRQKPGFEDFLCAESEASLLLAAQQGPIVVLNATALRSDAILLTKTAVQSITLLHLSHASMRKYSGTDRLGNEVQGEFLEWLWKGAIQPVLRELGFYPKMVDTLPRVWWIGVGLMAKAPVHAAAKFKHKRASVTTLHSCLPSYTSTIRALQYSRSRQLQSRENRSMLIVTMPTTPGESSLSGVTAEADGIKDSLRGRHVEILDRPTAGRALQALPSYGIAHFACHGVSEINPANSHLLLLNECATAVDRLRVRDISALKLQAARLSYLSACSTAQSTSPKLVDEVTHMVSSFHVAGFVHVIGTIWPSQDEACRRMAVDFYSTLSETDNVPVSYHSAIMGLMRQKPSDPMYWAPFILFGA